MSASNIDLLICPITQQIMTDPVTDRDGNTYDRAAIMQWLSTNNTSPITRRPMTADELVPNRIVRDLLDSAAGHIQSINVVPGAVATSVVQRTADNLTAVIVLDASGSMLTSCDVPGEVTGMTRIDLTKYSARVIIESLRQGDRVGLIAFSGSAYELAPIRQINSEHDKQILNDALNRYYASGTTNIYDAVVKSVTTLAQVIQPGEQASIFLLTDGEPTNNPPDMRNQGVTRCTIDAIMHNIGQNQSVLSTMSNITINTFGFGYNLLGDLMTGLTHIGDTKPGIFGFIPDATMLGTVFINAMSRARYPDPVQLNPTDITICNQVASLIQRIAQCTDCVTPSLVVELNQLITYIEQQYAGSSDFANALLLDLKPNTDPNLGQVNKAVHPEHFSKWGRFYLMALATAFQTRSCLNFKDNVLQCFKTPEVDQEQQRLSDIFLTATPPTPTGAVYNEYGHRINSTGLVNMSTYLNAAGGCFGPDSQIISATNHPIRITELKAGDIVVTPIGDTEVECIIAQPYQGDLYKVHDGLWLTAWHPFVPDTQPAQFPANDNTLTKTYYNGIVYNLVLKNRLLVGTVGVSLGGTSAQIWAATLGHSFTSDPVLAHPYYGSESVIDDLKATGQYTSGRVTVKSCEVHRDTDTKLVSAITYHVV